MPQVPVPAPGGQALIDPKSATAPPLVSLSDPQKRLRALISRRHPEYEETLAHWNFLDDTYEGGRDWFQQHIFKYVKEGQGEYSDRLGRAYRFNHTREVVDLVNKYLFKQEIIRSEDAPPSVKRFWEKATKNGLSIRDYARQASKKASTVGRIAVVVDNGLKDNSIGAAPLSKADEKKVGVRTYAYTVTPQDLLDYSYDDDGGLHWALIRECQRDDEDPFTSSGEEVPQFRLWTKTQWVLLEEQTQGKKKVIVIIDQGDHKLGVVPVILFDNVIGEDDYEAQSLIDDIAYLDRAVANYLSNLDAIIQDQTFSQLAMPAQNVLPGEDAYNKLIDMGSKRIFLYDGEGGQAPMFISPDPKQAQMILAVINKIINEIYHTVGLAGERTKQDNALGIDNSSGVAKAYDFERVNALLAAKADSLEVLENRIAYLVALWNGEEDMVEVNLVTYPDNFDVRGLYDEFDISARLMLVQAPDAIRQHQMELLVEKLFPQLGKELKDKIKAEIKDWPIDPLDLAAASDTAALQKSADRNTAKAALSQN